MMGQQKTTEQLFSYQVSLERRVPREHVLRQVSEVVDFTFVREAVAERYGRNGNESIDPVVILKLMFLLFFDNVSSERELMRMLGYRLDYLWFLGFTLDDDVPNHSVLSKARTRWGAELFEELFVRVVAACVERGLVDGKKIHMDGSLVDANAAKGSVLKGAPELIAALRRAYGVEAQKLDEPGEEEGGPASVNSKAVSSTDPDSALVRRSGDSRPRYKHHRVIDDAHGVITAVKTTPGNVKENGELLALVEQHEANTAVCVETVVADKQYGTSENFKACAERGVRSHMGDFEEALKGKGKREGIFAEDRFVYDEAADVYRCPAGATLTRRKHKKTRGCYEYAAATGVCRACALRSQCTRAASGARTIKRDYDEALIARGRMQSHTPEAKRDRQRRKWLMEGSFADAANNHGFKRARWRRLWRQSIQDLLIATVQNVRIIVNRRCRPSQGALALAVAGSSGVANVPWGDVPGVLVTLGPRRDIWFLMN